MLSSDWRTHSALAIVLMCVEKEAGAATIALERARTDPSEKKKNVRMREGRLHSAWCCCGVCHKWAGVRVEH